MHVRACVHVCICVMVGVVKTLPHTKTHFKASLIKQCGVTA